MAERGGGGDVAELPAVGEVEGLQARQAHAQLRDAPLGDSAAAREAQAAQPAAAHAEQGERRVGEAQPWLGLG